MKNECNLKKIVDQLEQHIQHPETAAQFLVGLSAGFALGHASGKAGEELEQGFVSFLTFVMTNEPDEVEETLVEFALETVRSVKHDSKEDS